MVRRPFLSIAVLAVAGACLSLAAASDEVRTESGLVSGTAADGVRSFKGIPYAAPPIGNLRWKPPQPVSAWSGVKAADAFGPQCPQLPYPADSPYYSPPRLEGEDCLSLNVWTAGASGDKRPVMVWMHGGGLTRGTGATPTYDGTALAKKGVVVVTINYRIGPLGYLSHPELTAESPQHASGNYGAMDQIAALKWVQKNIAAFGGDNGRVTIFGESAGSTSVNVLTASPLAAGLFQRAVGESGARFSRIATLAEAEKLGVTFAKAAGADSIAALRAVPAEKLVATSGFQAQNPVDGWVLREEVRAIYANKKHSSVPLIVGSNANEMTTLANPATVPKTLEEYRTRVTAQYGDLVKEFDALYPVSGEADVRDAWLGSVRDAGMTLQMRTWARMATAGGARAYLYWFSHVAPHPDAARLGAYHASEIPYVFANLTRKWNYTAVDRQLADTMSSYWANFAATGDPNGKGLPKWTPYDQDAEPYLDLGDAPQGRNHLQKARLDFMERFQNRPQRSSANNGR